MNLKEIEEKYPKALSCLKKWLHIKDETNFWEWAKYQWMFRRSGVRDLYDFFDEQDIYINVRIDGYNRWDWNIEYSMYKPNLYKDGLTVYNHSSILDEDIEDYDLRKEAEKAAFTKAFEILEEKLLQKEKIQQLMKLDEDSGMYDE